MMKKSSIISVLLIMSVSPALAQQWKQLGTYGTAARYFYNPKTFSASRENVVSTWTRKEFYHAAQSSDTNSSDTGQFKITKYVVAFEEFDCSKQKKRTLTGIAEENGRKTDVEKTGWQKPAKDSLDESLLTSLCRQPEAGTLLPRPSN